MSKNARRCGAKHIWKSKSTRHSTAPSTLLFFKGRLCGLVVPHPSLSSFSWSMSPAVIYTGMTPLHQLNIVQVWVGGKLSPRKNGVTWEPSSGTHTAPTLLPYCIVSFVYQFDSQTSKTHHTRTTFASCDVGKVHAVVARSTFGSQNVQSTPASDHFLKLRCRKSARRCGAKHILKSKVEKPERFGALLDVRMSFRVAGTRCTMPKESKMWGFCNSFNYNRGYTTLHYK